MGSIEISRLPCAHFGVCIASWLPRVACDFILWLMPWALVLELYLYSATCFLIILEAAFEQSQSCAFFIFSHWIVGQQLTRLGVLGSGIETREPGAVQRAARLIYVYVVGAL